MAKLISSLLLTLDGYAAGPNGELNIFPVDKEFFDYSHKFTDRAGTALYGRRTFEIMNSYWPTAADAPDASDHDLRHAKWYNAVEKIVVSHSVADAGPGTRIIGADLTAQVHQLKQEKDKDIVMFGSPSTVRSLMALGLIDEYWLFVAPVVLGQGLPFFSTDVKRTDLQTVSSQKLSTGMVVLHLEPKK
ncbi:MAG: dihydrofolate reductase family protein [Bacteroidetes bacterium]|nr:dihydrofolate reductase family protein [Bacteroidota bacterium]